jgi:hypothetical protein
VEGEEVSTRAGAILLLAEVSPQELDTESLLETTAIARDAMTWRFVGLHITEGALSLPSRSWRWLRRAVAQA